MRRKDFEAPAQGLGPRDYAPQRWPSVAADVTVPFLQSVITAFMISLVATGIIWGAFGLNFLKTWGITFGIGLVIAWFWRLGVITSTLWHIEEALGRDITGDHVVGKPQPAVRIEVARENRTEYVDIEQLDDVAALRKFAILGLTNRFNERAVKQAFGWSREHWTEVRDDLVERRWLKWNGPEGSTQGVVLTSSGEAALREILNHTT